MPLDYNINPATQSGVGAYGTVPGSVGIPPSLWDQLANIYPNMGQQLNRASTNIGNELAGVLSPETLAALKNQSASYGIQSGTIGSQFQGQQGLTQLGLNVEQQQRQGGTDYLNTLKGVGALQTDPALAASIAENNATLAAAPNPQQAAEQAIQNAKDAMAYAYGLSPHSSSTTVGAGSGSSNTNPIGLPTPTTAYGTRTTTTSSASSPAGGTRPTGNPANPWNYAPSAGTTPQLTQNPTDPNAGWSYDPTNPGDLYSLGPSGTGAADPNSYGGSYGTADQSQGVPWWDPNYDPFTSTALGGQQDQGVPWWDPNYNSFQTDPLAGYTPDNFGLIYSDTGGSYDPMMGE